MMRKVRFFKEKRTFCNGPPGRSPPARAHAHSCEASSSSSPRLSRAHPAPGPVRHPRHIQIGVPLHSTDQGRPENGTPWLAGARAAKEVAARFNFFQIRDSAISNPRIWIVSERPALSIKGPGKAAIQLFKIERGKLPNLLLQNCF